MSPTQIMRKYHPAVAFVAAYALCLLVQGIGGYYTSISVGDWYLTLNKSPLTPPGMWFGIVWTALYFLMALAAARVATITGQWNNQPLRWWVVQLFAGLVWCMVFFGHRDALNGMYVIGFELFAVLLTTFLFGQADRLAGMLMLPLVGWVSFATYLNLYILQHN